MQMRDGCTGHDKTTSESCSKAWESGACNDEGARQPRPIMAFVPPMPTRAPHTRFTDITITITTWFWPGLLPTRLYVDKSFSLMDDFQQCLYLISIS